MRNPWRFVLCINGIDIVERSFAKHQLGAIGSFRARCQDRVGGPYRWIDGEWLFWSAEQRIEAKRSIEEACKH